MTSLQPSATTAPPTKSAPPLKEPGATKPPKGGGGRGGSSSRGGRGKKRGGGDSSGTTRPPSASSSTSNAQAGPSTRPPPPKSGAGGALARAGHPPLSLSSLGYPSPRQGAHKGNINKGRINIMFRNPRTPASFDTDPDLRATLPKELSKGGGPLHKELMKSWKASLPTQATANARKHLIETISHVVASYGPQFRLALFGSAAIGGDREQSDMDLCIVDLNSPEGYQVPNGALKATDQIYNPRNLAGRLERAGLVGVEAIPWARTPIVKCSDPVSGIEVDINCNDLGGVHNTALILSYCLLAPYTLRPLIHTVKTWAKARKLNDPSGSHGPATFSSYSLNLLCITYLLSGPHPPSLHFPLRVKNPPTPTSAPLAELDPSQISLPLSNSSSPSNSPAPSLSSLPPLPPSSASSVVDEPLEPRPNPLSGPLLPSLQSPELLSRLQIPASYILIRGPSIRHRRNSNVSNSNAPPSGNTTSSTPELVNTTFAPVESLGEEEIERWRERNQRVDIGELAKGFFAWFGEISSKEEGVDGEGEGAGAGRDWKWSRDVASLLMGGKMSRKDATEKKWDASDYVIQDPFIHSKNCTGGIVPGKPADRILLEFKRAHEILARGGSFVKEVCEDYIETEPPVVRRNNRPPPPPSIAKDHPPLPQQKPQPGPTHPVQLGGVGGGGAWGTAGPSRTAKVKTKAKAAPEAAVDEEAGMSAADRFFAARMRGSKKVVEEKKEAEAEATPLAKEEVLVEVEVGEDKKDEEEAVEKEKETVASKEETPPSLTPPLETEESSRS